MVSLALAAPLAAQTAGWPQWGGPHRNFQTGSTGLAGAWPAGGPPKVWSRALGLGHSAIVAEDGRLFTLYRRGAREFLIALDAATGRTVWEFAYDAPYLPRMDTSYGDGPHSTPLVSGPVVCGIGATSLMHCLDKRTGALRWSLNLWKEFGSRMEGLGYSPSPVAWRDLIIVQAGAPGPALVALRRDTGAVTWRSETLRASSSTPLLIRVDGQDQVVAYLHHEVVAFDPDTGATLWRHPLAPAGQQWNFHFNISTPVWGGDNLLFVSTAYGIGGRALELRRAGGKTSVRQVWQSERTRVHKENAVRIGEIVYASTGHLGPAFLTAINVRTGEVLWRERAFSHATLVAAEGKFIILDEDGTLGLATPTPQGLTVHSRVDLLTSRAWTVPTLVGTRLYLRDRSNIMALELGR